MSLARPKMPEHPLRSLLSRVLHGPGNASDVELVYRHRGAPGDELKIVVSTIDYVGKGWFMLEDGETQIPFHRVLTIKNFRTGEVLWMKRDTSSSSDQGR